MSQKLPVHGLEREEDIHKFNKDSIEDYDDDSNKGYFLEVDVEYQKKLFKLHMDLPFLPKRKKIKKCNKLVCTIQDKKLFCAYKSFKTSIN